MEAGKGEPRTLGALRTIGTDSAMWVFTSIHKYNAASARSCSLGMLAVCGPRELEMRGKGGRDSQRGFGNGAGCPKQCGEKRGNWGSDGCKQKVRGARF